MKRIINNKRVEMTEDEYALYQKICRSNDRPNSKGEDLFVDLFETNGDGIITFVRPAGNRYISMEVYCFMLSLQVNQHLRIAQEQNSMLVKEASSKVKQLMSNLEDSVNNIKKLESKVEAALSSFVEKKSSPTPKVTDTKKKEKNKNGNK